MMSSSGSAPDAGKHALFGDGNGNANENTPLLRDPGSAQHPNPSPPLPIGRRLPDEDGIEPNEFDLLLSRSLSSCGPILDPEPIENSMLRGDPGHHDSTNIDRLRRGSQASSYHSRDPSRLGERLYDEEGLATKPHTPFPTTIDASTKPAALGSDYSSSDETVTAELCTSPGNPYLGGVSVTRFWLVFGGILATNFIACFDGTIMASSHPVITSYFKSSNSASWLSTAFLLTSTSFQPLLGRLSDSLGRKSPFVVTLAIFLFATIWCGLAQSMLSFIIARAVCGLGAGGMMSLGSIIISDLVPIEIRGSYQSYLNMTFGVGSTLGAAFGGAMADHLGWRWEFGVQVPFILACLILAVAAVPADLGIYDGKKETLVEAMRAFDFKGSILMSLSVTFLILGLNLGGNVLPWSHPFVIASLVIFGVCGPLFLFVESRATRPIMPLRLIRKSPHMNLIFANHVAAIMVNGILFNVPLYFQGVLLTSATTSGFRLIVPSAVASLSGVATGFLISKTRRLKWAPGLGAISFLVGCIALANMQRSWPWWAFLLCLVPSSMGQGFQFPGTFLALLALWDQRNQAVVTSTLILWRSLGMVLGVASSSLVLQNALYRYLEVLVSGPDKDAIVEKVRGSVEAVRDLDPMYQSQVIRSYEAALKLTFLCCAAIGVVNVLLIAPIKMPRLGSRK